MSPAVIPLPPHHLRPPLRSPSVEGSLPPLPSPPQSMDAPAPRRAHTCLVLLLIPALLLLPSMARSVKEMCECRLKRDFAIASRSYYDWSLLYRVVEVSTSKTGKHGHAKCHFVAIDIFNGKKLEDIVPSSHNCDIPHVNRTEYQLIDISEDGFVSLLTSDGNTKDDLRLPTDETLVAQAYLLAMLALVIVLFYFTIFAFIVTHRGYQELGQD
ncbi:Eukaryotic translation initiation factor 5A [Zea mays]|uniref:Eukaryotic translation initiation factor 5A n=1 Tax=Zea mays TaxID=4577 RepID=A0A3L6EUX2_MAIZE|nr:Eukaryotic translation initiation factor 5A [Zea mays]